jgi:prepilin-type N-terminal cleavage/methylation domain-containing protein
LHIETYNPFVIKKSQLHAGFTVLELVMVIVLVGLLSATVVPRFLSVNTFKSRFYFDQFFNALNYSIGFESTTDCASQFEFYDAATALLDTKTEGYSLFRANDCDAIPAVIKTAIKKVSDNSSAWQESDLSSRVYQFSDDGSVAADINSMLISRDNGVLTVTMNASLIEGEISIMITDSGITRSFKVDTNTGYVW